MSDFFSDQDQQWIIQQMESNLYKLYQTLVKVADGIPQSDGNIKWIDQANLNWPRTIYDRPADTTDLSQIAKSIQAKQLPPFWIMCRLGNDHLHQEMTNHGFRHMAQWPGMAITLNAVKYPSTVHRSPFTIPKNITVGPLKNSRELEAWRILVNEYLLKSTPFDASFLEKCMTQIPELIFYGLKVDGQLVTTALAFPQEKTVGLYMFSTAKTHRRQGFTSLLMRQILADAQAAGQDIAFLQASAEGKMVYPKLGFETLCDFDIYWQLGVR